MNNTQEDRIKVFDAQMAHMIPEELRLWLIAKGFFTAPASKNHHGNYEGALFDHSYEVMHNLLNYTEKLKIEWEKPRSPWIVGMFHDLCKIDAYIKCENAVERLQDGQEVKDGTYQYEYNKNQDLDGHGEKSCILLLKWLQLTDQEIMCIRYHMGAFEGQQAWDKYSHAVNKWPAVLWTHTADMEASQIKGI